VVIPTTIEEVEMTHLRRRMLEELQRRNYAETTIESYIRAVELFARHFSRPPDQLGPEHLRQYHLHLIERKLATNTIVQHIAGLRFFYVKTLGRRYPELRLPNPKLAKRLPLVLSREEVRRLIGAAGNLYRHTILLTLYATGMRRNELCRLKVADIDSRRMIIRIRQGKGRRDRDVPLRPNLLRVLRDYWRWRRPDTWLFPGGRYHTHLDRPISSKAVWRAVQDTAREAGIAKHVTPHTLRHSRATHLLGAGADLATIPRLLGHADLESTTVYLHLSDRHLRAISDPADDIPLPDFSVTGRRPS
jgi:integrase/recombinase XerD